VTEAGKKRKTDTTGSKKSKNCRFDSYIAGISSNSEEEPETEMCSIKKVNLTFANYNLDSLKNEK